MLSESRSLYGKPDMTRFKLIGHASVLISKDGYNILTDPWFGYDFHFGTFSFFPPIQPPTEDLLKKIDAIHISHIHQDHCCTRSLSLLPKQAKVVIARHTQSDFRRKIEVLGFKDLIELEPYQQDLPLGPFNIRTFVPKKFDGSFDSSAMISDFKNSFYFMNDCRLSEDQYSLIKTIYPKIKGCFLNYNSVNPYPTCYDFEIPERPDVTTETELKRITGIGLKHFETVYNHFEPEWVASYASNIRFLRKEVFHHNRIFEGLHEAARSAINSENFVDWMPNDQINADGCFMSPQQPLPASPVPIKEYSPPAEAAPVDKGRRYRNLLIDLWQKNVSRWKQPFKVSFIVQDQNNNFQYDFETDASKNLSSERNCDLSVRYDASTLDRILNNEMTFSNAHYAYRFHAKVFNMIPAEYLIHKWL